MEMGKPSCTLCHAGRQIKPRLPPGPQGQSRSSLAGASPASRHLRRTAGRLAPAGHCGSRPERGAVKTSGQRPWAAAIS